MDILLQRLQKIYGSNLKTDVRLSEYTKIGIGGLAKYFLPCNNIESFNSAINTAQKNNISFLALRYDEDILIVSQAINKLIIFLLAPDNNQPKLINLFVPVVIDKEIEKILINKGFTDLANKKELSPNDIFLRMGLVDKVFGGLKQMPTSPNTAINFQQATIDDVVIMSSYLKQQVRDKLGIQLKDNYKFIDENN